MDNRIAIVKSTALLRRVVEMERLVDDPEFGSSSLLVHRFHKTDRLRGIQLVCGGL